VCTALLSFFAHELSGDADGRSSQRPERDQSLVHDTASSTESNTESDLDAGMLARLRAGDVRAFDTLVEQYAARLVRFAILYTKDSDDADDVVADVLATFWAARETVMIRSSIETYLFGATRNVARQRHRNRLRRLEAGARFATDEGESPGMGRAAPAPDVAVGEEELETRMRRELAALPERVRVAITLRWEEQMSYDAIAVILGASAASVRQTVHRAIVTLRARLSAK